MTTKARQLAELIANSLVDSDEISTGAVTTSKLASTLDFSSKTMVMADNQLSGDKIHGGTVSAFASTGIDDNASATAVTILSDGTVGIGTDVDRGGILNVDGTTKGIVVRTTSSSAMELIHADNGAGVGPYLYLNRPSSGPAANDQIGRIVIQGKNSADQVIDYVRLVNQIINPTDGSEQGRFAINTMSSGTMYSRLNIVNGESVFNDESIDVDFRVESNNNANMLFVDAGNDRISVGSGSTYSIFNVISSNDNTSDWWTNSVATQYIQNTVGHPVLKMNNNNSNRSAYLVYNGNGSAQGFHIFDRQVEQTRISAYTSSVVINEAGADVDFRVESDNNTNALFVRGSDGNVGIGVSPSSGIQLKVGNSANNSAVSRVTNGTVSVDLTASSGGKAFLEVGTNHPLVIATNAAERMRIDSSGNVGIAKTSLATWSSGYNALQVGGRGFVGAHTSSDLYVGQNASFNSGWKYEDSVAASLTQHSGGKITHLVAPAGTAGNAISWNTAIDITPTGNVGIGTSNPTAKFIVTGSTSGDYLAKIESTNQFGLKIKTTSTSDSHEQFAIHDGNNNVQFKVLGGGTVHATGINLGGSAAANRLNDYEEGTWTPTSPTVTFTSAHGNYTKIGNRVFLDATFVVPSTSSSVIFYIDSIPFNQSGTSAAAGFYMRFTTDSTYRMFYLSNGSRITVYDLGGGAVPLADASGSRYDFSGVYYTDS